MIEKKKYTDSAKKETSAYQDLLYQVVTLNLNLAEYDWASSGKSS
jgi:hypothetical protein